MEYSPTSGANGEFLWKVIPNLLNNCPLNRYHKNKWIISVLARQSHTTSWQLMGWSLHWLNCSTACLSLEPRNQTSSPSTLTHHKLVRSMTSWIHIPWIHSFLIHSTATTDTFKVTRVFLGKLQPSFSKASSLPSLLVSRHFFTLCLLYLRWV